MACPACARTALRPWGAHDGHTIFRCDDCGTTGFSRPLAVHDYGTYYPYLSGFDRKRFEWEKDRRRRGFHFQLAEIERLAPPGKTLLDFGASYGPFCAIAKELGWDAKAVEISPDAVAAGKEFYGVEYVDPATVPAGSCSVVTSFHVLEHLEAPRDFVPMLRSKLCKDGLLVVHVPNFESLSAYLWYQSKRLLRGGTTRNGTLYYPEHITGFTEKGLEACITAGGFDKVAIRQCSFLSRYHLPLRLKEMLLSGMPPSRAAVQFGMQCVNGLFDNVGQVVGKGDWLVGIFRARPAGS